MENTFDDEFDLGVTLTNGGNVRKLVSDYINGLGLTSDQGSDFANYLREVYNSLPLHERRLVMGVPQIIMIAEHIHNDFYIIRCNRFNEKILANFNLTEINGVDNLRDLYLYINSGIERYFDDLSNIREFEEELHQREIKFRAHLRVQQISSRIKNYHDSAFDRDRTRRTLDRIRTGLVIERSTEVLEEFEV